MICLDLLSISKPIELVHYSIWEILIQHLSLVIVIALSFYGYSALHVGFFQKKLMDIM